MGKINVRGKNPSEWKISENMVQGLSGAGCVGSKMSRHRGQELGPMAGFGVIKLKKKIFKAECEVKPSKKESDEKMLHKL